MASLTVTEKEHWKERIARKIDRKIEEIAAQDPSLLDRVGAQARQHAMQSLGLVEAQAELDGIATQKKELEKREQSAHQAMLAIVRRVPLKEVYNIWCGGQHAQVTKAIQSRQATHEKELLADNPLGKEILRLRREKENLLDTIWLVTSPAQIKQLWQKVAQLLGDEPTELQKEAVAIGADDSKS